MSPSSPRETGAPEPVGLDAPATYARFDPSDMRARIAGLPRQSREAWRRGRDWLLPEALQSPPSRVVILAVGGSAIGGDVVATLASTSTTIPIQLVRNYGLPPLDERTLVVACSFSGETEEAIAAFGAALALPGPRLAITTGGALARVAASAGAPVFSYQFDGQPRSALGYGIFALLAILGRVGVLPVDEHDVESTHRGLERDAARLAPEVPALENEAKRVASWIHSCMPLIAGADFLEVAARRWAAQISENAKQWAFAGALPELNHNLIMGFGAPPFARKHVRALLLDAKPVHPRNHLRVALTVRELETVDIANRVIQIPGDTRLEAITRGSYLGDWVSLYLAMLNQVDPSTVDPIARLKDALAGSPME
ncbi:MAG: bifunctional phosphoglucose/phosphomannose isomerase [Dehalococcoidia bacterium]